MFAVSDKFARIFGKLILRDINNDTNKPTFYKYDKDDIQSYIANPYQYEKNLRQAVTYIYGASPHFRRLIQYFVCLSDLSYIVSPYKIDPKKANTQSIGRNYRKVLNVLSAMSIKTQFPRILTVCLREDIFYGTIWEGTDNIIVQQLPSEYCRISSIEGNVFNVSFNFAYFDSHKDLLGFYPAEFTTKYNQYKKNSTAKWIELDAPTSFAIKCNNDIPEYAMPPFAGILREIYDIEDYKALKEVKTELDNYAMLFMQLPMDDDGNWQLDYNKAEEFWSNLDAVTPEEIGTVLTPMDIKKIDFERTHNSDTNTVADAENSLFTAAGVSSLLFNNEKASANALALSIKVDQEITYGIVKSIEDMVNRYIQSQSYGKNFKVTFLDSSIFNRKENADAYLKAATYGMPTISMYCAVQGIGQAELDSMSYLEGDVLALQDLFRPIQSSTQMSSKTSGESSEGDSGANLETDAPTEEGGRPTKEGTELSDSGEQSSEQKDDWG